MTDALTYLAAFLYAADPTSEWPGIVGLLLAAVGIIVVSAMLVAVACEVVLWIRERRKR